MSLDVYLYEPLHCPHCQGDLKGEQIFEANITHNLNKMADVAGIYKHLWRPEEIGITRAFQLIEPLQTAIAEMEADPEKFKQYDAPNGWGLYEHFVPWLQKYLRACKETPGAWIAVSR
jgi:hypothetical protein